VKIGPLKLFKKNVISANSPLGPLLIRYIIFRIPQFGIYIHKLCRDDNDRALHDHPWPFTSIILKGGYFEHTERWLETDPPINIEEFQYYSAGSILRRPAEWRHRFALTAYPTWTLVFVGRRCRKWGFWVDGVNWCWWRKYNYNLNICEEEVLWTKGSD
jgi:hypothetical protein